MLSLGKNPLSVKKNLAPKIWDTELVMTEGVQRVDQSRLSSTIFGYLPATGLLRQITDRHLTLRISSAGFQILKSSFLNTIISGILRVPTETIVIL